MSLDPAARQLLDMVYRANAPKFHELTEQQARASYEKLLFALRPAAPEGVAMRDIHIPGGEGQPMLARVYRPLDAAADELLPVLVWFHGGGWCLGTLTAYDVLCQQIAADSGFVVVSVDYRLAPEHPFPAPVDDAWAALQWVAFEGQKLGVDVSRMVVGGDSAGGKLSAVCALHERDEGLPNQACLRAQLLVYPCVDIESERPSRETYGYGYFLDKDSLHWFFERYFTDPDHRYHWRASPLRAEAHHALVPACLVTAGCDPLTDDVLEYGDTLKNAGVAVTSLHYPGQIHGFLTLGKTFPVAGQAIQDIVAFLRAQTGA